MTTLDLVDAAFREFAGDESFPCLAGKGIARRRSYRLGVYDALGDASHTPALAADLTAFVGTTPTDGMGLTAFVAVFPQRSPATELAFEERLWAELRHLHDLDSASEWDPAVSSNPDDPRFAYSFAGSAMFVVGLHPSSSRLARRFPWPALVFNPRAQFERLRSEGHFERLREAVRERDLALQGSLNPNLADFGESSEARQYSGRATEAEWRCPFHPRADA